MQSNKADGNSNGKKTWKRELAVALFLYWMIYLVPYRPETLDVTTFPIFTFGALAFGMSWYSPNGGLLKSSGPSYGGRSQHSGQYSSREDEYPDSRDYSEYGPNHSEAPSKGHPPIQRYE